MRAGTRTHIESLIDVAMNRRDDVLLFLASFDGVLADYGDDPAEVQLTRVRLAALHRLQQAPGVVVAVMSGRPLSDLRPRIDLDAAFYVGLHGLEIAGPRFAWAPPPALQAYRDRMDGIASRLRDAVAGTPGVRLECKGPIIALHTRRASSEDAVWSRFCLLGAAADLVNAGAVRALRGRDVLELVPNVGCSRAGAVIAVRRCIEARCGRPVFTVYVGEDIADDEAVNAVGERGVAAVVGRRTPAAYHLESAEDVDALVNALATGRWERAEDSEEET